MNIRMDWIRKEIFNFQMEFDKKLQEIFQSCLDRGYKKEDFSLGIGQDNIYHFTFNGVTVESVYFKHDLIFKDNILNERN